MDILEERKYKKMFNKMQNTRDSQKKQRKVLIIDDSASDREIFQRYLERDAEYQYIVLSAEIGEEGLEIVKLHQLDVILLDYLLPDIDGLEFLSQLRQFPNSPPVIVLTGQGNEQTATEAMKLGAVDYLVKGQITSDKLRAEVDSAIETAHLRTQLRQSEERLRLALEASVLGTGEWNIKANRLICSELVGSIFGLPENSCFTTPKEFLELVYPEDRDCVKQVVKSALLSGDKYEMEFRVIHPDSSIHWVRSQGKVYYDNTGQQERLVGTVMDITSRKQAELLQKMRIERERIITQIAQSVRRSLDLDEILKTTVEEVRQFLQTDRVIIFRLLADGKGKVITESIDSFFTPILSTTIYDPCFAHTYIEKYRQGLITSKTDIYNSTEIELCHIELLTKFQVRANLVVPILQKENLWGLLIAHHCQAPRQWQQLEIDLLKQLAIQVGIAIQQAELLKLEKVAREQAESANRIKDEFLAILSHELRSPLNPILGWVTLLQNGKLDAVKIKEAVTTIERNVKSLVQIIDDLLDVSKILRGKFTASASLVDLKFIILSALEIVKFTANAKEIQIETYIAENGGIISGDAGRLQQMIWNLLSNAVKFTPEGGRVEVRLEFIDRMAKITVSDTGKGIKPEFLPYIFEYFRQEDSSTTRKYGGLGLGLAIVRNIVDMHGGTVTAESPGVGLGSTFIVRLPLSNNRVQIKETNKNSLILDSPLACLDILVVDDEADNTELLKLLLQSYGANVKIANSGEEALQLLARSTPDILISDIGMPEIDGYELLHKIRKLQPDLIGYLKAIALTAYAGDFDKQKALAAGYQLHLKKPIEPEELVQAIIDIIK